MTRWFVLFACVFTFAAVAPMGFEAEARKAKRCAEVNIEGKKVRWQCRAKQECCFNFFTQKGACCSM